MLIAVLGIVFARLTLLTAQRLTKPPVESTLNYLEQGLEKNLPIVKSTKSQWGAGWIPQDCKTIVQDEGHQASDIQIFSVTYDDCANDPWILCRHKDSPDSVSDVIDVFSRVPVLMRQWVKHVITLPDTALHAYNSGGNIAVFGQLKRDVSLFIHETGHSLDLLGAYAEKPLSSSGYWLDQYSQDTNTVDNYAQTNQVENVAQNTVVGTYNEIIPFGYSKVEKNSKGPFHQYATLQAVADSAGKILHPGGKCTHRLPNGPSVPQSGSSRLMVRAAAMPDVSLSDQVEKIEPKDFNTKEHCQQEW